jgi:hypothetical protein
VAGVNRLKRWSYFLSFFILLFSILPSLPVQAEENTDITIIQQNIDYDKDQLIKASLTLSYGTSETETGFWFIRINNSTNYVYQSAQAENTANAELNLEGISPSTDYKYTLQIEFKKSIDDPTPLSQKEHTLPFLEISYKTENNVHKIIGTFKHITSANGNWNVSIQKGEDETSTIPSLEENQNQLNTQATSTQEEQTDDPASTLLPSETDPTRQDGQNINDLSFTAEFQNLEGTSNVIATFQEGKLDEIDTTLTNTKTVEAGKSSSSEGELLPNTSTFYPNGMLIGAICIVFGILLFRIRRA